MRKRIYFLASLPCLKPGFDNVLSTPSNDGLIKEL